MQDPVHGGGFTLFMDSLQTFFQRDAGFGHGRQILKEKNFLFNRETQIKRNVRRPVGRIFFGFIFGDFFQTIFYFSIVPPSFFHNYSWMTRRISPIEVMPVAAFFRPSSSIGTIPSLMAASRMASAFSRRITMWRICSVISKTS